MQIVAFFYNFFVWSNLSQKWGYEKLGRTKILFLLLSTQSTKKAIFQSMQEMLEYSSPSDRDV